MKTNVLAVIAYALCSIVSFLLTYFWLLKRDTKKAYMSGMTDRIVELTNHQVSNEEDH